MSQLIVDLITSLDGYASAEGWPGWWGLESQDRQPSFGPSAVDQLRGESRPGGL